MALTASLSALSSSCTRALSVRCSSSEDTTKPSSISGYIGLPSGKSSSLQNQNAVQQNFVDPAASFANLMYANQTFNAQVFVGDSESVESVVRRFKRVCLDANVVNECRRRRFFETKQDIVKRKQKEGARTRKRLSKANSNANNRFYNQPLNSGPPGQNSSKKSEDDEDRWDVQVDL